MTNGHGNRIATSDQYMGNSNNVPFQATNPSIVDGFGGTMSTNTPALRPALHVEQWSLPQNGFPRLRTLLSRAARRVCPYCGQAHIFKRWFSLLTYCPVCGVRFAREDGYFLGAMAVNLVVAEMVGMSAVIVVLLQRDMSLLLQEAIAITFAVGMPLLFYPFSRTFWMAIDLYFDKELTRDAFRSGQ